MTTRGKLIRRILLPVAVIAAVAGILAYQGSTKSYPSRNPTGELFPSVVGESLQQVRTEIPEAFAGEPTVLLIGYEQNAQFDIDRWLMGLMQTEVPMQLVEIPTIPGLLPSFASDWIDNGMRSGIPKEDWGSVVTLYGDAARPVAELTGTDRGRITRVVVLDSEGTIVKFDDEGYSPRKALEVAELVQELRSS